MLAIIAILILVVLAMVTGLIIMMRKKNARFLPDWMMQLGLQVGTRKLWYMIDHLNSLHLDDHLKMNRAYGLERLDGVSKMCLGALIGKQTSSTPETGAEQNMGYFIYTFGLMFAQLLESSEPQETAQIYHMSGKLTGGVKNLLQNIRILDPAQCYISA
uniref:Uncharacterized protein n=1 Tax=Romanomermis culicivorax TaxID=13658 RepID=A0A915IQ36_ROMCU